MSLNFGAALMLAGRAAFSAFDSGFLGTGVTLSANRRTATFSNATFQSTRGTLSRSTGKHYFEVAVAGGAGSFAVGLCISSDSANNGIRNMTNGVGWESSGGVYLKTVNSATWGTYAAGDTICVAVDCAAKLIWLRKGAAGNWNNSGAADPATATGGFSFSTISGAVFPTVSAQFNTAENMTINTGQAPFVGARPSGFYIWE
jgi:hypothetical protein